jgi:ribonuclease III
MRAEPAPFEASIGHRFSNGELLRRALTHSSSANEARVGSGPPEADNQQLEFLGDSVLGFLVSEELMRRNPSFHEGELSRIKAHLVSAAHLYGVARRLDLGAYLSLGRSEEMSGGRSKKTLLVDALEAVIAAIYFDAGLEAARTFVSRYVLDAAAVPGEDFGDDVLPAIANYRSALQERAHALRLSPPRYTVVREQGPEHSKIFTVEVRVGKEFTAQADGRTKKLAAQRAARSIFDRLSAEAPQQTGAPLPPLT